MLIIRQPPAFQYLPQMNCTQPYAYIFMFAINTLYQFLLFTLSCTFSVFHFVSIVILAERRKQMNSIQFNSYLCLSCMSDIFHINIHVFVLRYVQRI